MTSAVLEINRMWNRGSEVLFGCGGWGRGILRRWCWAETPHPYPLGLMRNQSREEAFWAEGKEDFLTWTWGCENLLPTSQNYKGLNEGRLMCEIFKFSLCEKDYELFSWNLSPAPQAPWKLRTVWFFSCEGRPAQYRLDGTVSTRLVRYIQTLKAFENWHCGDIQVLMVSYNLFSFYFSISLGWTEKETP